MEKDDELKGEGNSYDFGARMLDPRIGRWFARDPLEGKYPYLSPYTYVENNPMFFTDSDGKDAIVTIRGNTITVKAVIYVDNSGKNKLNIAKLKNGIMKYWGGNHKDSSGKYNVKFDIQVREKPTVKLSFSDNIYSTQDIGKVFENGSENYIKPEKNEFRSFVQGNTGNWAVDDYDSVYAHEIGHILGLTDLYSDYVPDPLRNGVEYGGSKIVSDERTEQEKADYFEKTPHKSVDYTDDDTELMASASVNNKGENAKVSTRSVDAIVKFVLKNQKNGFSVINAQNIGNGLAQPTFEEITKVNEKLRASLMVKAPTK